MSLGIFVTGTDTGIGKTYAVTALLRALNAAGAHAVGMKPVASGCQLRDGHLVNDDALSLQAASTPRPDYAVCNPFALHAAIAPHLAAAAEGTEITLAPITAAYAALAAHASHVVVEGAGGWDVPLSADLMQVAIPRALGLPVLLVVGLRLGCINHALLSARAIIADGCELIGWIGNRLDPEMQCAQENLDTLTQLLPAPCLGVLPHAATPVHSVGPALHELVRQLQPQG